MRRFFLLLLTPALAFAQTVQLDADNFKPATTGAFFGVNDTSILPSLQLQAGLFFHLVDKPFLVLDSVTNEVTALIARQNILDLTIAVGLFERLELSLTLPAALSQQGEARDKIDQGPQITGGAIGDVLLGSKLKLYGDASKDGISAAAVLRLTAPTGNQDQLLGGNTALNLSLLGQWRSGPLQVAANFGPKLQQRESFFFESLTVGSSLQYSVAASYLAHPKASVGAELDGAIAIVGADASGTSPLEGRLGAKLNAARGLWVPVGLGVGLLDGVGAPRFRVFAGVSFTPQANPDPDQDGLTGSDDRCPKKAETKNQYEDEDGCPDTLPENDPDGDTFIGAADQCPTEKGALLGCPDDDNDQIANQADKCATQPEDLDQFEDTDGCPEEDNDRDGLADKDDNCPLQPGTVNTLGCPDQDADGVADIGDNCPQEPEDVDQFEDQDGCPDNDNDKDTIADKDDQCPNEAEDFVSAKEGCPEKKSGITITKATTIDLSERRIFFDINSDKIQKRSYETLDLVVQVLNEHPEYKKVLIEGHTDDIGNVETNQKLSERRAKSVQDYLISKGIDPSRLSYQGFGMTRPLVKEKTRDARDKNRRVEFVLVP